MACNVAFGVDMLRVEFVGLEDQVVRISDRSEDFSGINGYISGGFEGCGKTIKGPWITKNGFGKSKN